MDKMTRVDIINEVHANIDFFHEKWNVFCQWVENCAKQLDKYQCRETRKCETISQERRDAHKAWRSARARNDRADRQNRVAVLRGVNRKHKVEVHKMHRRFEWLQAHGWAKWAVYPYPLSSHGDFRTCELMLDSCWDFYAPRELVNPVLWVYGCSNPREPDPDYQKERLLVDCALLAVAHDATVRPTERIYPQGTYQGKYFDCDSFYQRLAASLDRLDNDGSLQRAWHDLREYGLNAVPAGTEAQEPLKAKIQVARKPNEPQQGSKISENGAGSEEDNVFEEGNGYWTITFRGKKLPAIQGREAFAYVAYVLTHPNGWISAMRVMEAIYGPTHGGREKTSDTAEEKESADEDSPSSKKGIKYKDRDDQADRQYLKECYERLSRLRADQEHAKDEGNEAAAVEHQQEIDKITSELERLTRLGGRLHKFSSKTDRAYSSIRKAKDRVLSKVGNHSTELCQHLTNCIHFDKPCISYRPEKPTQWRWVKPPKEKS